MSSSDDDEGPPIAVPLLPGAERRAADTAGSPPPSSHAAPPAAPAAPPIPVTLITGYLGAGKTTLVNHILTAKHGYRCAVLLNEIADSADIERALVKEPESQEAAPLADWVQLENGCICCSVKGEMVKALEALVQQRERFDYILIETTGLANPGPVAAALWTDAGLEAVVCLDAIVTVVDARNIRRQLAEPPEVAGGANDAQQQVAFADVVLLNKTDLVDAPALEAVEAELRAINGEALVLRCQRCAIDLAAVLGTGLYTASGLQGRGEGASASGQGSGGPGAAAADAASNAASDAALPADHVCSASCHHEGHAHGGRVRTVTLRVWGAPLDLARLRHWLDELLWEGTEAVDLFRIKGLLHVAPQPGDGADAAEERAAPATAGRSGSAGAAGSRSEGAGPPAPRKLVLQGVHELYDVVDVGPWPPGEQPASKLVFIGRHLQRDRLLRGMLACQLAAG